MKANIGSGVEKVPPNSPTMINRPPRASARWPNWAVDSAPTGALVGTATVAVTMTAGSALLYAGSLWHGGGANTTERPRIGVVLHYSAAWLRPVENHVLAVPPAVVRTLSPRLQELLGYNVYPPFVGYVDGRHPRRLLD